MGFTKAPEICFITDLTTSNIESPLDGIEYRVGNDDYQIKFRFDSMYQNSDFISKNKYILKGLFFNKRWPIQKDDIYDEEILKKIIQEAYYPKSPKEKIDNLILYLHSLQSYEGQVLAITGMDSKILCYKLFFKNEEEYSFYLFNLYQQNYIEGIDASTKDGKALIDITLTYTGLEYIVHLQEEGRFSNICFIAMSFNEELIEIRNAIKSACVKTGFKPVLIDEVIINPEQTINDGIISYLKKSRYCIADFTEQKDGVYFESGFALGRGLKVIYTCRKDWFEKSHFDTNHFPHIIYNLPEQLEIELINRIQSWID